MSFDARLGLPAPACLYNELNVLNMTGSKFKSSHIKVEIVYKVVFEQRKCKLEVKCTVFKV